MHDTGGVVRIELFQEGEAVFRLPDCCQLYGIKEDQKKLFNEFFSTKGSKEQAWA
jgi:hypothetical protein